MDEAAMAATVAANRAEARAAERGRAPAVLTDRERRRELWTADTIRRDRDAATDEITRARWEEASERVSERPAPTPTRMSSGEQIARMGELAREAGIELAGVGVVLTEESATAMIRELENAVGPEVVAKLDARAADRQTLVSSSAPSWAPTAEEIQQRTGIAPSDGVIRVDPSGIPVTPERLAAAGLPQNPTREPMTKEQIDALRHAPKPVAEWKTGADPIRPRQHLTLANRGYTSEELAGMTKGEASLHIDGPLTRADARAAIGTRPAAEKQTAGQASVTQQVTQQQREQRQQQRRPQQHRGPKRAV